MKDNIFIMPLNSEGILPCYGFENEMESTHSFSQLNKQTNKQTKTNTCNSNQ